MMSKLIAVLVLLVITLPLAVNVLFIGTDSVLGASTKFFSRLIEIATYFGVR